MGRLAPLAGLAAAVASAGCSLVTDSFVTNEFSGDPFPIQVDTSSGGVVVGVRPEGALRDLVGVIDVLSPLTLIDPGPDVAPSFASKDLLILGQASPGGPLELPRARLRSASVLSVHPCTEDPCAIGPGDVPLTYDAVIGADALAGDALRLRLGDDQIFILADVGGTERERTQACDGVFPAPFRGGGTLVIGGTEQTFSGRRIALPTCLGPDPDPALPQSQRGADALLVVSSAIGVSVLGESAYGRYREADPTAPELATLPPGTVYLPSGPIDGRLATLPAIALVAASSQTPRSACRQVFASHLQITRDCIAGDDCPCDDGDVFCGVPSVVELTPAGGVEVLVVPDATPTLQSLRAELRPDQAEVDGILGTNALRTVELDADYPHNRVLARCTHDGCVTRPGLSLREDRPQVQGCIAATPVGPLF